MINQQLIEIKSSMQFNRDYFRLGVKALFVIFIINALLIIFIGIKLSFPPTQRFYATTTLGTLAELIPSNKPVFLPQTS